MTDASAADNPSGNPGERRAAYALIAPAWLTFVVLLVSETLYGRFNIFKVNGGVDRT